MTQETIRQMAFKVIPPGERHVLLRREAFISGAQWVLSCSWRPSEKQIKALEYALGRGGGYDKGALEELYRQLLKMI